MLRQLLRSLEVDKDRQVLGGILSTVVCTAVFGKSTTNARPMRNSKTTNALWEPRDYENGPAGLADVQLFRATWKLPVVCSHVPSDSVHGSSVVRTRCELHPEVVFLFRI